MLNHRRVSPGPSGACPDRSAPAHPGRVARPRTRFAGPRPGFHTTWRQGARLGPEVLTLGGRSGPWPGRTALTDGPRAAHPHRAMDQGHGRAAGTAFRPGPCTAAPAMRAHLQMQAWRGNRGQLTAAGQAATPRRCGTGQIRLAYGSRSSRSGRQRVRRAISLGPVSPAVKHSTPLDPRAGPSARSCRTPATRTR